MSRFVFSLALILSMFVCAPVKAGDVIDLDLSLVDPASREIFSRAEKFWEDRIVGYSNEIPGLLRNQIGALLITVTVEPIDGVGGGLAFAGPDATVALSANTGRIYEIAIRSSITVDIDDFDDVDGILFDTIVHELGHALGVGSLWEQNNLVRNIDTDGDFGTIEQINYVGRYGVEQYAIESGQVLTPFVPVETRGGGGAAGGHWFDGGFFNSLGSPNAQKALMTGFACDENPNLPGDLICLPTFLARATLGSLADLGFAVKGVNERFAVPRNRLATDLFPKGHQIQPVALARGVSLRLGGTKLGRHSGLGLTGKGTEATNGRTAKDPYKLRDKKWADQRDQAD